MLKWFLTQFENFKDSLLAPLYFHFGQYSWFWSLFDLFSDLGESNIILFLLTGIISGIIFKKNEQLQVFFKKIYKNFINYTNFLSFNIYFHFVFINITYLFSLLIKTYYYYFKKK